MARHEEEFDDTEVGSLERFAIVFRARLHVLMNNRRQQGKPTCNPGSAKAFLMAVINHDRGQDLGCCARQTTLERESGLSEDSQLRVANILEDAGVLRVVRRHKSKGARKRHSSNQYFVELAALNALAIIEPAHAVHGSGDDDGAPRGETASASVEKPRTPCAGESPRKLRSEQHEKPRSTGVDPEKTSRSLRDDRTSRSLRDESRITPQSAGSSSRSLRDDHPAVCGAKNKHTTGQDTTGQQRAVGERAGEGLVCVSGESPDERRALLKAQASLTRNTQRAAQALRDAGVWEKPIAKLLATAAKASGGDPLPRIEAVIAAANAQADRQRKLKQEFNAGAWIARAITDNWDLNTESRRTA